MDPDNEMRIAAHAARITAVGQRRSCEDRLRLEVACLKATLKRILARRRRDRQIIQMRRTGKSRAEISAALEIPFGRVDGVLSEYTVIKSMDVRVPNPIPIIEMGV